jgi:hypothetical protein
MQTALRAFERMKRGQSMLASGEKWQHWYRGDKKMNLRAKEKQTDEVLSLLQK